jgi:hypothetical protein
MYINDCLSGRLIDALFKLVCLNNLLIRIDCRSVASLHDAEVFMCIIQYID